LIGYWATTAILVVAKGSKFIEAVSTGWPHIFASLKSLLETGESLEETREWPREACK
jgi:hypothetical protein